MATNRVRTEVSGRKASRCQVSGKDGLRKWLYYSYQGFSCRTCTVLDHLLCSHFREQSPASNPSGTAPTSKGSGRHFFGMYLSCFANLLYTGSTEPQRTNC